MAETTPLRQWYVYCLVRPGSGYTYVGYTHDVARRLRKHNGELAGGAKSTTAQGKGRLALGYVVAGLASQTHARQLEWLLHRRNTRIGRRQEGESAHGRRIRMLHDALAVRPRVTTKAPLTSACTLTIHCHGLKVPPTLTWPPHVRVELHSQ